MNSQIVTKGQVPWYFLLKVQILLIVIIAQTFITV